MEIFMVNLSLIQRKALNKRAPIPSQNIQYKDKETPSEDGLYYKNFAGFLMFSLIALFVLVYVFYEP